MEEEYWTNTMDWKEAELSMSYHRSIHHVQDHESHPSRQIPSRIWNNAHVLPSLSVYEQLVSLRMVGKAKA